MTKTYLIEKDWGRDIRVTVEDDVQARVNYSERPDVMVVTFERRTGQYEMETVVAYANVANLRLEDPTVVVEEKQIDYPETAQREEVTATESWVRV